MFEIIEVDAKNFREHLRSKKRVTGVYIWYSNKECIYVGASTDTLNRGLRVFVSDGYNCYTDTVVNAYKAMNGLSSIFVKIIVVDYKELKKAEEFFFKVLHPKSNRKYVKYNYKND